MTNLMLVTLYAVERCYGGPEEGGWYYDRLTPIRVAKRIKTSGTPQRRLRTISRAVAKTRAALFPAPERTARFQRHEETLRVERYFGQNATPENYRPHYE